MDLPSEIIAACDDDNVIEVNRMLSDGVDVNIVNEDGATGLIMAMILGKTEVSRILLGCNNIKIDIKDSYGNTALHYACDSNNIECVRLFLEQSTCNKDIVKMKNNDGETPEMIAEQDYGSNNECARLIREYLKSNDAREVTEPIGEDARSVDDLVEFIMGGETQKKKRKKKRKSPDQSGITGHSGGNSRKMVDIGGKKTERNIITKTKDDSGTLGKGIIDTIAKANIKKHPNISIHKEDPETNTIHVHLNKIEEKIAENYVYFNKHNENVMNIIHANSIEIKNLDSMMEKSQDEKKLKLNEVDKLDEELFDLETKMTKIRLKKTELLEESKIDDKRIKKYEEKKHKLEGDIEKKLKISRQKCNSFKKEIQDLETKLHETKKLIQNLPNDERLSIEPNKELIEFIDNQIVEKEKELECPVCLDVACSPIFMCSEQHLICSTCRPKLSNCPECRVGYTGKNRIHRYAEKTAEELIKLKNKKDQVGKTRVSTILVKF